MERITRNTFLRQCMNMGALTLLTPYGADLLAGFGNIRTGESGTDEPLMKSLVAANDKRVEFLLTGWDPGSGWYRIRIAGEFATFSASYCSAASKFYEDPEIVSRLEKIAGTILTFQKADGTIDAGNLGSPPDTAFFLENICTGTAVLMQKRSRVLDKTLSDIKKFIVRAGVALTTGGVHTPNHRWALCAALARINNLYPDPKYIDRIDDWLGEGIYCDSDGHFPERSRNYSRVEDNSLITLGRLLGRSELYEPVRRNLSMTYYYMEPGGELVTNDSRRQDQYSSISISEFYLHYRYMSIYDDNSDFAAITRLIEGFDDFEGEILGHTLCRFLEEPLLQRELPASNPLNTDFEVLFDSSHLLRIRRDDMTLTLFGGVDLPLIIASGRSCSPNFFSYTRGSAALKYMRMSSRFFNTGYFYSDGLVRDGDAYILYRRLEVPYYQPLPEEKRNGEGDYSLSESIDHRFWNRMSFEERPVSNVKVLDSTVKLKESDGTAELTIEVTGQKNVMVTLELCFKEGGTLTGVSNSEDQDDNYFPGSGRGENLENFFLESGTGEYRFGDDSIHFGPGIAEHKYVSRLEGERYSTHRGTLRTGGMHVYLTGVTPFNHTLRFW